MAKPPSFSSFTAQNVDTILTELSTTESGLSLQQAAERAKISGPNELSANQIKWYDIFLRQFHSAFLYLLIGSAILSLILHHFIDGLMILIFVLINALLGFYQEYRSEKTLQLLKHYIIAKTTVLREGAKTQITSSELVTGDIIFLQPGDIIPADIRFLRTENIVIDESILTGESVSVSKTHETLKQEISEPYKARNIGFSGTTVISGKATGVVVGIGKNTVIGNIATLTVETKRESSFQKSVNRLSNFILKLISATLIFIVIANILLKGSDVHLPTLLIFAIALAISVIPEALPVVTTFSFSRGALRLAKRKVVVKRLSAIEDLGGIEVLCTDKTGTITENVLSVHSCFPENSSALFFANLAVSLATNNDSFDTALQQALPNAERKNFSSFERLQEIPFDPIRRMNSVVVAKKNAHTLVVRGALESVLPLCTTMGGIPKSQILKWAQQEGSYGRRIIAVAKKNLTTLPLDDQIATEENNLEFVGLIAFEDPLKKTAASAIKNAEKLGVKIKIITGDSKDVAGAIAFQTGLITSPDDVLTGEELDKLSLRQQHDAVAKYAVFARIAPEQKYRIIQLLQEKYTVGFLGEGINDAPALKVANVAIVVQEASGIAREAADIVLLNKSLHVIVDGIKEGRKVFGNTAKYIKTTLASNFGNFYTVAIASLFIPFLPLLPLQILLINLLTDFPMIAIATDNVDDEELKLPKTYDIKEIALFATIMGILSSLVDFLFFLSFYKISPEVLQTNWFIGCVMTELIFLFSVRTKLPILRGNAPSRSLLVLSLAAFVVSIILPFTTIGQNVFSFITPTFEHLTRIVLLIVGYFVATEVVKRMYYRFATTT